MSPSRYRPPSRPVPMGTDGMVASAHPLATLAGLHVLLDGGNAFDAAIATAVTLSVVEPHMSGVGGIGVALAHVAREGRVTPAGLQGPLSPPDSPRRPRRPASLPRWSPAAWRAGLPCTSGMGRWTGTACFGLPSITPRMAFRSRR